MSIPRIARALTLCWLAALPGLAQTKLLTARYLAFSSFATARR